MDRPVEDELKFTSFQELFPHLFTKVVNEASDSRKVRRRNINAAANRYDKTWNSWSKSEKLHVGLKLIDLFIDATNYAQIVTRKTKKNKSEKVIIPTQEMCDFIERNEGVAALLEPIYLPMVVPPEPWTSPTGGGYLTHYTNQLVFS